VLDDAIGMIERGKGLEIGPVQGLVERADQIKGIGDLHRSIEGSLY
jgi:hypothetical protein